MVIHPVGAELLHADRRTDITKLIVAFRSFANAPKKRGATFKDLKFTRNDLKEISKYRRQEKFRYFYRIRL